MCGIIGPVSAVGPVNSVGSSINSPPSALVKCRLGGPSSATRDGIPADASMRAHPRVFAAVNNITGGPSSANRQFGRMPSLASCRKREFHVGIGHEEQHTQS